MTKIRAYVEQLLQDCEVQYKSWVETADREPMQRSLSHEEATENRPTSAEDIAREFPSEEVRR